MWHVALGSPGQCEPGWHRHQPSQPMAERGTPLSTPRPIRAAARGTPAPAGYPISCGVAATSTPVGGHCSHSVDGRCALHAQQLAQLSPPSRGSPQCRALLMKTPLWRRSSRPRSSWLRSPHRVAAPTALLTAALTLVPPSSWPRSPHSRLGSQCSGRGPPGGAGTGNRRLAEVSPVSRGWVVGG